MTEHIEQATAAPGETRSLPASCECGHSRSAHRTALLARPCRRCECKQFRLVQR